MQYEEVHYELVKHNLDKNGLAQYAVTKYEIRQYGKVKYAFQWRIFQTILVYNIGLKINIVLQCFVEFKSRQMQMFQRSKSSDSAVIQYDCKVSVQEYNFFAVY